MEISWQRTNFAEFQANLPKLCGKCVFTQNFYSKKSGEIMVFYAVKNCIFDVLSGNPGYHRRYEKKKNILSTKAVDIF